MKTNILYNKMRKMINLIDELKDIGLNSYISLPRIAVLGLQSAGKSSLLESIVGFDFLPRGEGTVTRRPLELRLIHLSENSDSKPYAIFDENKEKKYFDFELVRAKISEITDRDAGVKKGIIEDPIVLNIYSKSCPDLSLVDLPGITKVAVKGSDHPSNIEEITINLAKKYIDDPRTIILCVIQANVDISTSDALKIATQLDKDGDRTLGVITKIDLVDKGTNIENVLMNEEIPLNYGYVACKGRSQNDIKNNKTIADGLVDEEFYFENYFSHLPDREEILGTKALINKLTKILGKQIKTYLPNIIDETRARLLDFEDKYLKLGAPLPDTEGERQRIVINLVNELSQSFENSIKGKYTYLKENEEQNLVGNKIRKLFKNLFNYKNKENNQLTKFVSDKELKRLMINYSGNNFTGFPSFDAFKAILKPFIENLSPEVKILIEEVYLSLEENLNNTIKEVFVRFPDIQGIIRESCLSCIKEFKEKTEFLCENIIKSEINWVYTGDKDYLTKFNEIFIQDENAVNKIRDRVESYLEIVLRSLRDSIPKIIGHFLLNETIKYLSGKVNEDVINNKEISQTFTEPEEIILERKTIQNGIRIMKNCIKKLNIEDLMGDDDEDDY